MKTFQKLIGSTKIAIIFCNEGKLIRPFYLLVRKYHNIIIENDANLYDKTVYVKMAESDG
jgi:hypothetical protein